MSKLYKEKLANGLNIFLYQDNNKHSTQVKFVTKFGGINQDFMIDNKKYHVPSGIAHLLEHYICESSSLKELIQVMAKKQIKFNASTSMYLTNYYFSTINNLEYGLKNLLKAVNTPVFSEENLKRVKAPIYQELKMHEDDIFYEFGLKEYEALFKNIQFRNTGGFREDVEKITLDDIKNCYKVFYNPHNEYLFVGGNFNKNKVLKIIKDFYKNFDEKTLEGHPLKIKESSSVNKKEILVESKASQEYVEIAYKIDVSNYSKKQLMKLDYYLCTFLDMNFGITSSLYSELVDKKIINTSLNYDSTFIEDFCIITIGSFSKKINVLAKKIKDKIKNPDFLKEEFNLFKKEDMAKVAIRADNLGNMIYQLMNNVIFYDYPYFDSVDDFKDFKFKEFQEYINKLDFTNYTTIIMKKTSD